GQLAHLLPPLRATTERSPAWPGEASSPEPAELARVVAVTREAARLLARAECHLLATTRSGRVIELSCTEATPSLRQASPCVPTDASQAGKPSVYWAVAFSRAACCHACTGGTSSSSDLVCTSIKTGSVLLSACAISDASWSGCSMRTPRTPKACAAAA